MNRRTRRSVPLVQHGLDALVRILLSASLALTALVINMPTRAIAAGGITFDKTSSLTVLLGGSAHFTLTAGNAAGQPEQYNLSYTDALPPGVAYVGGSTSPSSFGEPQVITTEVVVGKDTYDQQTLVWANVSDLTPGAAVDLGFDARVDPILYPIGSKITNTGSAFSSSDPRELPEFDSDGAFVPGDQTVTSTDSSTTTVSAIRISKGSGVDGDGTPENELLRGVNDHQTVYALTVTNNGVDRTDSLVVTDFLPAGIEFLGCGGKFNSTVPEYPGASNTVGNVAGCTQPITLETVKDPAGYPSGVYTKVVWQLAPLAAAEVFVIRYAAAIPQRSNTMDFPGGIPATDGAQAANLDNNTGAPTVETASELALENFAEVAGSFQGADVADTTNHTVTAEDLRILKGVSPTEFAQGGLATYTLVVDTSEYADASELVITDELPAGLCPVRTADPGYTPPVAECAIDQGDAPTNGSITGVRVNPDGSFTLTITPDRTSLDANGHLVITYQALMREFYDVGLKGPTSAMDSFINTVRIDGITTPPPVVEAPSKEPERVSDESSATIDSGGPQLTKLRMRNATPMACSSKLSDYQVALDGEDAFTEGDRVCFFLHLTFPDGVDTRSPELSDFLPTNLSFESATVVTGEDLVAATLPASPTTYVQWLLGSGSPRVVPKGSVFEVVVSAIVTKPPTLTGSPKALDKENLAKFRYTNTAGVSQSLRDAVSIPLGPPPPIGITKGVQAVNATVVDGGSTPGNADGSQVRGSDQVVFRIDVQNLAMSGEVNADQITAPDVWDVLPAGVTCVAISAISDAGACFDAGAAGRPSLATGDTTSSVIRWQLPASWTLAPQAFGKLTYTMTVPSGVSASARFDNTAAVASFSSGTNLGGASAGAVHNPANNISAGIPAASLDVPAARDTSWVVVPDAAVTKSNVTDITETGNTAAQAVVGETLTYTVAVRIPARTSVFNGQLADPMPTGLTFVGPATALFSPAGTAPATLALPAGVTVDPATGTLSFGTAYTNATATDQLFEVKVPALVNLNAGNTHAAVRTNTATFTSDTAATGGTPIPARTGATNLAIVAPSANLTKSASPTSVTGGQTVTYTLTASNAAARPPLHDSWVLDCLPGTVAFNAFTTIPAGTSATTEAGTGSNGCAVGFTRIAWNVGTLAGGTSSLLRYTGIVNSSPAGAESYTNTATLTGGTLKDTKTDPLAPNNPNERVTTVTRTATVNVAGATVVKSATPTTLTVGQRGSWTVTATIPAGINFHDASIIDLLPDGMDLPSLTTDSVTCTQAGGGCTVAGTPLTATNSGKTIGWFLGDLAGTPQVRTVTITYSARLVDVAGNAAGITRTNSATIRWNTTNGTDPTSTGAIWARSSTAATAAITVIEPALTIAKAVDDTTVEPGQIFTYTVTVTNNGRAANLSPAHNITVVDTVPTGVVVNPASISSGGVLTGAGANGGGTITWTVPGPLAANASTAFSYSAQLAASATLTTTGRSNTADITRYESLASGGRVYDGPTASRTVTPQFPHVTVAKSVAAGPAYLDKPKTWTITVTNDGTATARGVDVTDTLPTNWVYDAGSANIVVAGGAGSQLEPTLSTDVSGKQVLSWTNAGSIPASGADRTLVVTLTATPNDPEAATDPGAGASINHTNTVAVVAEDATGATGNASGAYNAGQATASTQIHAADIRVTKTSGDAVAGQDLTYSLVVRNDGPDTAVGPFTVVDTLPGGLGAVGWTGTGWTCSVTATTISCTRTNPANTLASGASFPPISLTAAVPASTDSGTVLTNTATVGSATYDPNPGNNTDTVADTVARAVDLGIVKTTSGTITAGQDATYTLDVTNHGPSDSNGPITVTDDLPTGTTFVSAAGTDWDCSVAGLALTCTRTAGLDNGRAGPQISVVVHVSAGRTADLTNTASVDGPDPDPNPANDTSQVSDPVRTSADLTLTKVHEGTFIPGSTGTYRLSVTNLGPSDAAAPVRITDQLAPELTFVSDDTSAWGCSADAANLLTCTLAGSLPAGDTSDFTVTVTINPAHTGDIANSATVGSPTSDPHLPNNTDTDNTGVSARADLGITKSHTGDAIAGEDLDFALQVTNHGESGSPGPITASDTLPAGMSYRSATGAGWDCSASGQVVTCTRTPGLIAGASASITLRVAVAADAGPAELTNTASVAGTAPDPNPDNDTDADVVTVNDLANVRITKTADPSTAPAGDPVAFTLTVTNDGPSDADNVNVTDALPPGLEYVSVTSAAFTCADTDPIDCLLATLPAGDSHTIIVTARVGSAVADGATIVNRADVSASTPGDDPDDNSDQATLRVITRADLGITKTHPDSAVLAGEQVTFDLAVHNFGPSDAVADVVVTDNLPAGMSYLSNSGSWTCAAVGREVTCTLDDGASVPADTDAPALAITAQVAADIDPDTLIDGVLTNTAAATSGTTDPNPDNNTDSDSVAISFAADLSITKSHTVGARVGDPLTFTIQIANTGPSTAHTVTVADTLPAGLDFVSAAGEGWTCTNSGQQVDCELADPLPTATAAPQILVTVTVLATAYPQVVNSATVDAATTDPVADNNSATDLVTVPPQVDLGITKSHTPGPLQVGSEATYTLAVSNAGATDDPGPITVSDPLPAGVTFVSGTGDGWNCSATGQDVTCTRTAGLATTGNSSIALVVAVGPAAYPAVTNTASVASPAEDTNPGNNNASDPAAVLPLYDLALAKELTSISNSRADWRLTVTNNGPNPAPVGSVVITDNLPDELSYGGFTGDGWTCSPQGQTVLCSYDAELPAGESRSLELQTAIRSSATGVIVNTASVVGGVTAAAEGRIPTASAGLASTGGLATGAAALGLLSLLGGAVLLLSRKRRT